MQNFDEPYKIALFQILEFSCQLQYATYMELISKCMGSYFLPSVHLWLKYLWMCCDMEASFCQAAMPKHTVYMFLHLEQDAVLCW